MAAALSTYAAGVQQIVLVQGASADRTLENALARDYLPFSIVLRVDANAQRRLSGSLPFIASMAPIEAATAAYVCHRFACRAPVTTVEALHEQLRATA
jgi:uncharacterized protein YyaL (SSP411 family)